ncbi:MULTISPECIES: peptide chain release factor N(5)-glutamine methyltransferase [unclassified Flavobacterium]|uniref:peptide chain release factor N(5)-glutamine methyltransferase n=1 Tax=unclassified Flavobacterium TaxID=196869 RepID=UPI001291681D|nr:MULTISPECIES: peptide chain release factor N(5)-glutamine methyltransferase [unclassified Flavobacterium]MQP52971.1 peptide chain release factor N(5)-glutamine methyltransferase [Flavobacterium sp. LMO9]MQP62792.1 peptide chain release factor N(5)-glutamine methyltransferase [Flavobacterium sp. LMO6]
MVIKELKTHFFNSLKSIQDEREIESFFFILTEYLHNLKRVDVALNPNFELSEDDVKRWNAILSELQQEKPIQYITGEAWFYGLQFEVNENTLIPRPETEELVEWILNSPITHYPTPITILDIGTGTGCIPISLKANLPQANVSAIDVSVKALAVAKRNAQSNKVEVNFIEANILEVEDLFKLPSAISHNPSSYNIIVSNPPYVRNLEKQEIKKNVLDFEPHLALFVEDTDALLFYRKIAQLALKNLSPNGLLFFEINQYLGKETVELLKNLGFKNIDLKKDIYGNDRMIKCKK